MNSRLKIAKDIIKIAKMMLSKVLEIIPYDGETFNIGHPIREIESSDSNIGNRTDHSFPYEIWAIDLNLLNRDSDEFSRISRLIRAIQSNRLKRWILWTTNTNVKQALNLCRENGFSPDAVNDNVIEVKQYYNGDSRKVYAHHYIDLKNVAPDNVDSMQDDTGSQVVYAIDFDGTIAETDNTFPYIEKPNEKIINFIKKIQSDPNKKWILYTCRIGEPEKIAERWCRENGLFPDAVNSNLVNHGNRKVDADYYIDDRNVDLFNINK